MNEQRLLRLADFLETEVPPERFNLGTWGDGNLTKCGTAGCACGWATTIPEFKEAGFVLMVFDWEDEHTHPDWHIAYCPPGDEVWTGWDAATKFFDITKPMAVYLFSQSSYHDDASPADVAACIRKFVENGKPKTDAIGRTTSDAFS